jgi:hypothetical protein
VNADQPPLKPAPDRRAPVPRRRSVRAECEVPVLVKWVTKDGSPNSELTKTKVINAHGCLLTLQARLAEGTPVELVNQQSKHARTGRIAWCGAVAADGRTEVAIELADADPQFWGERYVSFLVSAAAEARPR